MASIWIAEYYIIAYIAALYFILCILYINKREEQMSAS